MRQRKWYKKWGSLKFGIETNRVHIRTEEALDPYLDRYILHFGIGCVRLHKFWRGDDMRALHDHPFGFVTIPLTSYVEVTPPDYAKAEVEMRVVRAFLPHFRAARFRHSVLGRLDLKKEPFWTIVVATWISREWGFWPSPQTFVHWEKWE